MSYAIVYSSRTGNTALLAKTIREVLGEEACVYFGPPAPQALAAQTVYAGFWTDRGTCNEEMAHFLQSLTDQTVFCSARRDLEVRRPITARFWNGCRQI